MGSARLEVRVARIVLICASVVLQQGYPYATIVEAQVFLRFHRVHPMLGTIYALMQRFSQQGCSERCRSSSLLMDQWHSLGAKRRGEYRGGGRKIKGRWAGMKEMWRKKETESEKWRQVREWLRHNDRERIKISVLWDALPYYSTCWGFQTGHVTQEQQYSYSYSSNQM